MITKKPILIFNLCIVLSLHDRHKRYKKNYLVRVNSKVVYYFVDRNLICSKDYEWGEKKEYIYSTRYISLVNYSHFRLCQIWKFKIQDRAFARFFVWVFLFYIYMTGYSYLNKPLIVTHPVRYSAFVTSLHIGKVNLGLSGPAGWSENMVNVLLKLQKKFD